MRPEDPKLSAAVARSLAARGYRPAPEACGPKGSLFGGVRLPLDVWEQFLLRILWRPVLNARLELEYAAGECESPIEELMFLALVLEGHVQGSDGVRTPYTPRDHGANWMRFVEIVPQANVGRYRIDFEVSAHIATPRREEPKAMVRGVVLVECDGHDFHERTKEQASHDKKKDRELQRAGFTVFRYTGSDVWRDCTTAAKEAVAQAFANAEKSLSR